MDSRKYFSSSYIVIWGESMDSCKILMRESKWILALGREFLTLRDRVCNLHIERHGNLSGKKEYYRAPLLDVVRVERL